jgi:tripartite-type tricarboxylate transporter receptor subunit TctC
MKTKGKIVGVLMVIFLLHFAASGVSGKDAPFPEKEIRLLCGYSPGSVSDLNARSIAKVASKYLKKPIVVVNMPGAAATIAANELVRSPGDGYTVITITTGYFAYTIHQQKVPFDPALIKPLLGYWQYSHILFAKGDGPFRTAKELVDFGRKHPDAIKYALPARGTGPHLMGIEFFRNAQVKAADLPFKGSGENAQAVIGGNAIVGVDDFAPVKHYIKAGSLRALVAFLDKRHKDLPDVPTSGELGYGNLGSLNAYGILCIRKDTPPDRAKKLHDIFRKVIEDQEFTKTCDDLGQRCGYADTDVVEQNIRKQEKLSMPVLKELKLFVR